MKGKVYRGTKEIGGTCVELTADNGRVLWIDLGSPLEDKNPNTDYTANHVDALLISHPHQDHFGLMEKVGTNVPVFIGSLSLDLIAATRIFIGKKVPLLNFQAIYPWRKFMVADTFEVTAYLTDHSTPEAFAFLIEADGKRVFYSGDFRATGRLSSVFEKLSSNPPPNIDLLLMEGTMIERTNHLYPTEKSVEMAMYDVIKHQPNVSFVICSAQNLARFISLFRACKRARKILVIDVYTAWILEKARAKSLNIPSMEWDEIRVYNHPGQMAKIADTSFEEFRSRVQKQSVGNDVFSTPSNYVYLVRSPHEPLVNALRKKGIINIMYSQWEGYLREEHKGYCTDYLNRLRSDAGIVFQSIHTSGHATITDLLRFAKAIAARTIVPIHTAFPKKFKQTFEKEGLENVVLWEDGKEYQI